MTSVQETTAEDAGRAFHSSYFEMLGEQGYPGLLLWLVIHLSGLVRMEVLRRRWRNDADGPWIAPLANALQSTHIIYLVGSLFVGIAFQAFMLMLIGVEIDFDNYLRRLGKKVSGSPFTSSGVPASERSPAPAL